MDLTPYVDSLRHELMAAAEGGEATALAERLTASVVSATRLTMLDVLSVAADEITRDLLPGSVDVRLRGRNPFFVVTSPNAHAYPEEDDLNGTSAQSWSESPAPAPAGMDGPVSRINFRPPEQLKQRVEAAAADEGMSVNAWLVRATTAALTVDQNPRRGGRDSGRAGRFVGWVG